jgi:HSP20 family protein
MSLVKFNTLRFPWFNDGLSPFLDVNELFADDFFSNGKNVPAMNVKENRKDFEIELSVPGFEKKDIKVVLENDELIVNAQKSEKEIKENENGYTRKEFSYNEFERRMALPNMVDEKKEVKAAYNNGILTLKLLKKEAAKIPPKKLIEIA